MALFTRLLASAASSLGLSRSQIEIDPGAQAKDDAHLAATALLVHVAQADGVLDPSERERLVGIVRARYAESDAAAGALVERAALLDAQTRDMSEIVELMGRETDPTQREALVASAWAVAAADGDLHEFEEALVWRLGKLLGLDEMQIARARDGSGAAG